MPIGRSICYVCHQHQRRGRRRGRRRRGRQGRRRQGRGCRKSGPNA